VCVRVGGCAAASGRRRWLGCGLLGAVILNRTRPYTVRRNAGKQSTSEPHVQYSLWLGADVSHLLRAPHESVPHLPAPSYRPLFGVGCVQQHTLLHPLRQCHGGLCPPLPLLPTSPPPPLPLLPPFPSSPPSPPPHPPLLPPFPSLHTWRPAQEGGR
jgi:hypothetical protein